MDVTSSYYLDLINSIQSVHTKKKYMIKKPAQTALIFLLQNPHRITCSQPWGGYSRNVLHIPAVLSKQSKKVNTIFFVTQNAKWHVKFKKPVKKKNNLCYLIHLFYSKFGISPCFF